MWPSGSSSLTSGPMRPPDRPTSLTGPTQATLSLGRSGQIGQVEEAEVWDFTGRAHPTAASSVDAADPTPTPDPHVDTTDQPDQTLADPDALEAEIERVRHKFPYLFDDDE